MKFEEHLGQAAKKNHSLLCIGLDPDLEKLPKTILNKEDPLFFFNREIINATQDLVCAFKPNIAFYELQGLSGLAALIKTIEYIKALNIPVILDAKRGDVGHSSAAYAKSIFQVYKADATTVNPFMGQDSLMPFLEYKDKGIFILCLTSNQGSSDFEAGLYKSVVEKVKQWNKNNNCGLVVGATKPEQLKEIRELAPQMPILIPGVGAQGGDLAATVRYGTDKSGNGAIINSSRAIIYASAGEDFALAARTAAQELRDNINQYRQTKQKNEELN